MNVNKALLTYKVRALKRQERKTVKNKNQVCVYKLRECYDNRKRSAVKIGGDQTCGHEYNEDSIYKFKI